MKASAQTVQQGQAAQEQAADAGLARLEALAPRPSRVSETGLSETFLADLLSKHLLEAGVLTLSELSNRIALAGPVVEALLQFLRKEARVEVRGPAGTGSMGHLRYALTERGRAAAVDAMFRSGYVGPAPVPLDYYTRVVRAQTVHDRSVTRPAMQQAFDGIVLKDGLLDQLGPALNSGRAIFIYGPAGTGKTYITQKLMRLFPQVTLLPYAIAINETVIEVFDPVIHQQVDLELVSPNLMLETGFDARFICCKRPVVISGGELTADMLDVHFDATSKHYQAPLQLKANNGIFIIDDMGRQRVAPETVFNRWIVPLEEKRDFLTLGAGRHFSVPFDVVLVFSTNLHPTDLADEAFLRRIGYKIEFKYLDRDEYRQIWDQVCAEQQIECEPDVFRHLVHNLYDLHGTPMAPCHPRDLLGIAVDRAAYHGETRRVSAENLDWAWANYFVSLKPHDDSVHAPSMDGGR